MIDWLKYKVGLSSTQLTQIYNQNSFCGMTNVIPIAFYDE